MPANSRSWQEELSASTEVIITLSLCAKRVQTHQSALESCSDTISAFYQAFVDQVLMRVGKSEQRGWLRYCYPSESTTKKTAYFVVRGAEAQSLAFIISLLEHLSDLGAGPWLYHYENDLMEDPGIRLVKLDSCSLRYVPQTSTFDLYDSDGRQISFECGSGEIDTDYPQQPAYIADAAGVSGISF